ncbi:MAG: hypothetical protein ACRDJI_12065 [Actinomycetota bacterium]
MVAALQTSEVDRFEELLEDPLLTVACVLLIVVSVAWVVITRLIVRRRRRAALRGLMPRDSVQPPRDIWTIPP